MCSADFFNPVKTAKSMFSKDSAFGLDPLNLSGRNKDRGFFTAPGSTGLKDEREAAAKKAAAAAYVPPTTYSKEYLEDERKRKIREGISSTYNTGKMIV